MANADLSISVTANTGQATTQISNLNKTLVNTGKSSDVAGQSLVNLGRIAQDAPFGFIGIQNNLNPLLESFQRLKSETGSTGSALKALGASMLGAGGVGFALSVVSAGVLFFQSGLFSFGESSKKATEEAKKFAESLDAAKSSAISSGLQLQTYADIAANTNNSLKTRNEALEKANKIMGEHGEKLTLVNIATKGAREEIDKFTQATINQALASKFADKAADLIISRAKAFKEFAQARKELDKVENTKDIVISGGSGGTSGLSTLGKLNSAQSTYNKKLKEYTDVTQDLGEVTNELNSSLSESARLFGELGTKPKAENSKKVIKSIKETIVKAFEAEQMILRPESIEVSSEKIKKAAEKAQKDLIDSLGKKPMITKVDLQRSINNSDSETEGLKRLREIATETLRITDQLSEAISTTLVEGVTSAFAQIGDSIGSALSGGTDAIGNFFGGLANILAQSLQDLGKYVIKSSVLIASIKKVLNAAFAGNPALGIAVGVSLIAIGAALKNSIPKFANGVNNFGGGMAIVGERGPELVRLPKGSDVIPNGRVNNMQSGGAQVFIPAITLRGQDLVVAFNRANQTINRNG